VLGGALSMRAWLLLAAALLGLTAAWAADDLEGFSDPALNARYQRLIREVRCVQCQNTSIAGSSVELAADLREQIREMIAEGASDSEITEFLVARYGDFIMYRPPLKPTTWALWGGPVAMLGIGLVVFWRVARSRAGQSLDDDDDEAAEEGP
jgi:cytochrome c-type biogenesis protein CcmH